MIMASGQCSSSSSSFSLFIFDSADSSSVEEDEVMEKHNIRNREYARSVANVYEEISEGQFKSEFSVEELALSIS